MSTNPAAIAEAPKADSYYCEIPNDPCAIVMFGASGDLARRKLLPALYDLALHSCLAPRFKLLGFARTQMNDDAFRKSAGEFLSNVDHNGASGNRRDEFLEHISYFHGNYDNPEAYKKLAQRLEELDAQGNLRRFVNIYVGEEDIRFLDDLKTALKAGDQISIVPAIAGG